MPEISISNRTRATPFTDYVTAAGVSGYTVYNHMLLPTFFRSFEEDCHHLKTAVQIWDVSCERQVELKGPDAAVLAQLMTPRDLSNQRVDQTLYTPICDNRGYVLNDPVTIKLANDRYWLSVADSDVILFAKGLAIGKDLDVDVFEPDVHPLAVQGPKSFELMARVFGDEIRQTPFFGAQMHSFGGRDHLIARSGYSGQGGFEIYLDGGDLAGELWNTLSEAGVDLDVRAGCPNAIERIESGLLSYGNDFTIENTLGESGLTRFCKNIAPNCVAANALRAAGEPTKQIRYLTIGGEPMRSAPKSSAVFSGGAMAGKISSLAWSPDYQTNVAIGMIGADFWTPGTTLRTEDDRTVEILDRPIAR